MCEQRAVLRNVMRDTSTSQSELSRLSGVRQPSISQFLSGKVDFSDGQLDRLLSCMGYRLKLSRRPVEPDLTRAERRSWELHRHLARQLTRVTLAQWHPTITGNLELLRVGVNGQPHTRNIERWAWLLCDSYLPGLHRVLTGLDRDGIEMREVSPMAGLLSDEQRLSILAAGIR